MECPDCGPTVGGTSANFCDTAETTFGNAGRNIFRSSFQTRFDFGVSKTFKLSERFQLRYDAQFFNIFNHPSFDAPSNSVSINSNFGSATPCFGTSSNCAFPPAVPNRGQIAAAIQGGSGGFIQQTIGSPRIIQMALHLTF